MNIPIQITFYCKDPEKLAGFWVEILGYKIEEPPDEFETWADFLRSAEVPECYWNSQAAAYDPTGKGPRFHFFRLDVEKEDKNRLHLDLMFSGGPETPIEQRRKNIDEAVARMISLGAEKKIVFDENGEYWIGMRDPEGNEFCVQ